MAALLLSPGLLFPLTLDQGMFGLAGQILLDGDLPYRDLLDQKGPALHYMLAMVMGVLGESQFVVRLAFVLFTLVGALAAAELAGRLAGRSARAAALVIYCLVAIQGSTMAPWRFGQAEDVTAACFLVAIVLLGSPARVRPLVGGLLLGVTPWVKLTAALPAAAIAIASLPRRKSSEGTSLRRFLPRLLLGMALPSVGFLGLLLLRGNWSDFWYAVVSFNAEYAAAVRFFAPLSTVLPRLGALTLLAAFALPRLVREPGTQGRMLLSLMVGAGLVVLMEGKLFDYHLTPVVAALSVPAGMTAGALTRRVQDAMPNGGGVLAIFLVLAMGILVTPQPSITLLTYSRTAAVMTGSLSLDRFRAPYKVSSVSAEEMAELVAYVRSRTNPEDRVLVLGHEGLANFLMNRRSPTRHVALPSLVSRDTPQTRRRREEFTAEVLDRRPAFLVLAPSTVFYLPHMSPREALGLLPELERLLREEYEFDGVVGGFEVYRRRAARAP